MHVQGGEDDGGKGCEKPDDVEKGDHFGDDGGGFHAVLDWVGKIEVGEEGWDAGHVDGLRRVLVVGRVVGAVCQVLFALRSVVTLSELMSDHAFQKFENTRLGEILLEAFSLPRSRLGDVQRRIAGCSGFRLWHL